MKKNLLTFTVLSMVISAFVMMGCEKEDKNAIKEANGLKIPVFAMTDTNVDPTNIDYVIPMNDDAIKATKLVLGYFVEAIKEGKK